MKAKTLLNVSLSNNNSATPYNGKVLGVLTSVTLYPVAYATYNYQDEQGNVLFQGKPKEFTNEQANAVLNANPIDSMSKAEQVFYSTLKAEMASTFGIELDEIVIEA